MIQDTPTLSVPFADLSSQTSQIMAELSPRLERLLESSAFVLGPEVTNFENAFAAYCHADHAIGVASGTDALVIALRAVGVQPGDEVITAANSFIATAEAIAAIGAVPVLVDVREDDFNIDVDLIEAAITARTKAVVPVHLYGQPADMESIVRLAEKHGLKVVEDACQSHGAEFSGRRTGSLGDAAAFSFYPSKNLGGWGDGGAITTGNADIAHRCRLLRNHGEEDRYNHVVQGACSRLDSLQAAVLDVKLQYLDDWNEARRASAALYHDLLDGEAVSRPVILPGRRHVFHLYVVRVPDRDELRARLSEDGIQTGVHYPAPIHLNPAFCYLGHKTNAFPVTERLANEILSLPIHASLTNNQIAYVSEKVNQYVG